MYENAFVPALAFAGKCQEGVRLALLFLCALLAAPCRAEEAQRSARKLPVPWSEAGRHVGKTVTVAGKVVATHRTRTHCLLHFHKNHPDYFTVIIERADFPKFPKRPDEYYYNKEVLVSGRIFRMAGRPMMAVYNREQIWIVGEALHRGRPRPTLAQPPKPAEPPEQKSQAPALIQAPPRKD